MIGNCNKSNSLYEKDKLSLNIDKYVVDSYIPNAKGESVVEILKRKRQ